MGASVLKEWLEKAGIHVLRVRPGFAAVRIPKDYDPEQGFFLHRFLHDDGSFDYERYRAVQLAGNEDKRERVFVQHENVQFLARYITARIGRPSFGLCHGTRRGLEQKWFGEELGCRVLGTEISPSAAEFPNTIQWDFHDVQPEWKNAVDFIYSNSLDHSYDPEMCLNAWMSCLRPGGLCVLEHSSEHEPSRATELDPFGVELIRLPFLITKWSKGRYGVRDVVRAPATKATVSFSYFVVIQRFADDWSAINYFG